MRYKALSGTVGAVTLMFMFAFIPPFVVGLMYGEDPVSLYKIFLAPFFITLAIGTGLFIYGKDEVETVREREAVVAVALAWLLIAFLGSLPYVFWEMQWISQVPQSLIEQKKFYPMGFSGAFFESMSGFATCGATVIGAPPQEITALPLGSATDYLDYPNSHSIFFWRSLTQWVGGMGIIVFSVVIISKLLGGTVQLFKAETAGDSVTRIKPKIQQTASILLKIYFLFTLVQTLLLWGSGLSLYDSLNHSFTTLATGGFGTYSNSVIAFSHIPAVDAILITFMILGSISFVLHYKILSGNVKALLKDPELGLFMMSLLFFSLFVIMTLWMKGSMNPEGTYVPMELGKAIRYGTFNVVSIHTTTGYANFDYGLWPQSAQLSLVIMMLLGGCVGSTAGAIKLSRVLILAKVSRREVQKVLHPRAFIPIRVGDSVIPEEIVKRIGVFFFAYLGVFFISSLIMTLFIDDIGVAISAVATTMGGVGPGIGTGAGTLGPSQTFAFIGNPGKIYLALCMWAGRLEIFSAIILFFPSTYKE